MKELLVLFAVHWLADFVLQPESIAKTKSKSVKQLTRHVLIYTIIMGIPAKIFISDMANFHWFLGITFVAHFITDYFTSKWTAKLYKEKKYYGFPAFFSVIGLDQFLHQAQIVLCWYYLILN